MSFLIILIYLLTWGLVAWFLAKLLVAPIGHRWGKWVLRTILFVLIAVAPIVDEFVGRRQFAELCKTEAVVVLSPNWAEVKKAKGFDGVSQILSGYVVPIYRTRFDYIDLDTRRIFLSSTRLGRQGGFVFRRMGVGEVDSCEPTNQSEIYREIDIDRLTKNGSSK